ncbi:aminotransferase class V-fold PLP-dependent enzyme [Clostridium sp. FS41]|uniref:aminotransferase class V-fold PLP-dependent enzyme n=1 Tax=Clostridia TaxID=186801 RepID=UPI0005D2F4B5|nr:aminotransferase class V-fold PLP-dependent enzyme [Clostridium sp. FS41]KJJ65666.1 putative cysteine desulfurase [Clostridium sp. FS41]
MIYLDNAATSYYRPDTVAEAVAQAIRTMGNCSRGAYEAALTSARAVYGTRALVSELFHGEGPEQVAFTANSTESLNIAIKGVLEPGDRVVATVLDHNSVLRPLYEMERQGAELVIVGCTDEKDRGCLDYGAMEAAIRPGTKAVVCTHASNLTGNLVDIRRIGGWCRKAGALFIVDASQTAGVFPIDMERDMIDILCFTGHKGLMGPQGTGGMCVRKGVGIRPLLSGGSGIMTYSRTHPDSMPTALEAGTLNAHGLAGLRASLTYIREQGVDEIREKEIALMRRFYDQVKTIPGVRIYGDFEQEQRAAVVALNLGDEDSGEVSDYLAQEHEIYTRSGGHCAPLMHETLGTREQGAVRFSFSHFNREEEVDMACLALRAY